MVRILKRPMFRRGGMPKNEGITAVRPEYMGGGMTGIMSGIIPRPDAGLTPRIGYANGPQPNFMGGVPTVQQPTFFTRVKDAIFPTTGTIVERMQKVQEAPPLGEKLFSPAEGPLKFRTKQQAEEFLEKNPNYSTPIEILQTGEILNTKIKNVEPEIEPKIEPKIKPKTETKSEPTDQETIKSYMDMFQAALGEDQEDITRDRYLQLAKFGANLLAQPGGDLTGAIGKAAAPSFEGLAKTEAAKRAGKREINLAAIKTALSQISPTELERRYNFLKGKFPDKSEIEIANMLISGETGKARTQESRITTNAESLTNLDPDKRLIVARSIEASGIGFEKFRELPKDKDGNIKKDKQGKLPKDGFYYDQDGDLFKIEKGQLGKLKV